MTDTPPPSDHGGPNGWSAPPAPPTSGWGSTAQAPPPPPLRPPPPSSPPPPAGWPGAPTGAPLPYYAPALPTPPSRLRIAAWVVTVVALLAAAVVGVIYVTRDEPTYPDEWDPEVAILARLVEQQRGLRFDHPVYVDFLTAEEYSDRVRVDGGGGGGGDQADTFGPELERLRALGLASGDVDLAESRDDLADAGTLAFYDLVSKRVVVRGTEMTPDVNATLVHELTHALQDQHFDLTEMQGDLLDDADQIEPDAFGGYQALVEGDAMRMEDLYVAAMSEDEFEEYMRNYNRGFEDAQEQLGEVPQALQAFGLAPYVLGRPLVRLVEADGGQEAVDDAFGELPSTGEHMLDPRSYLEANPDEPVELDDPPLPEGVDESTEENTVGAVDLFVVLAERIDPIVALHAADGWGNGRSITYEDDDRTCVRMSLATDSPADADELEAAFDDWLAAAPAASDAGYVDDGPDGALTVESCDPGEDELDVNDRALDVLQVPAFRSQLMVELLGAARADPDDAWEEADCVVGELGYENVVEVVTATDLTTVEPLMDAAFDAC